MISDFWLSYQQGIPTASPLGEILIGAHHTFNPLYIGNSLRGTLANSEDPDKMLHHAAFHQDLHYLLR